MHHRSHIRAFASLSSRAIMEQQSSPARTKAPRRAPDSPDVKLSKSLSYVLRHGAAKEKLPIGSDGYLPVSVLFTHSRFRGVQFADIVRVVDTNTKSRFKLEYRGPEASSIAGSDPDGWWIRANQGHSIAVQDLDLEEIVDLASCPIAVHGTNLGAWNNAIKTEGLSKMGRNHIHLATGMPGESGVISGMRAAASVFIYIDIEKAIRDGMKFYKSENGVVLTEGKDGIVPPEYFKQVLNKSGKSLL